MRVVYKDEQLGIMPTHEARRLAEEKGLDLVEVSPRSRPPVCRILDHGKEKYNAAKKAKERKTKDRPLKELKFRPKTDDHDVAFKLRNARKFLEAGHKVKLVVRFRGRERVHPELGEELLSYVKSQCEDIAKADGAISSEGRQMSLTLAPTGA